MEILTDFMDGDEIFEGFSQGTLIIFLAIIGLSIGLGVLARRFIFPALMNLFSKTERIDGKTLFAPASLGWMVGTLFFTQAIDYIARNCDPVWNQNLISNLNEVVFTGFIILMLIAAYRLVDYLDAFIVVEGDGPLVSDWLSFIKEGIRNGINIIRMKAFQKLLGFIITGRDRNIVNCKELYFRR